MEIRKFKKNDTKEVADIIRVQMSILNADIQSLLDSPTPLDYKTKKGLKNLIKSSEIGVNEMIKGVCEGVSCVACEGERIVGFGVLRDVKASSACMVLPEYQGQGIEIKLDEACWKCAFEERPPVDVMPQYAYVFDNRELGKTLDTMLQIATGEKTKPMNSF